MNSTQFAVQKVGILRLALLFLLGFFSVASFAADDSDFASLIDDAATVDEAVALISDRLENLGYTIAAVINHQAAAAGVSLELRPTQVIMARQPRTIERKMLKRAPTVGIDLPIKFLVFEDADGDIQLRVNSLGYVIDRHQLPVDWVYWSYRQVTEQFSTPSNGLVTIESNQSVTRTADALIQALTDNGAFGIPLQLNYKLYGRKHGPILIVFGNPNAGTPLMQSTQEVAIDLPQKMLIWRHHRHVYITYNDPFVIAERHNIEGQDMRLDAISNALAGFAQAAAGD